LFVFVFVLFCSVFFKHNVLLSILVGLLSH